MYFNGYLISGLSDDALVSLFNSISGEMASANRPQHNAEPNGFVGTTLPI